METRLYISDLQPATMTARLIGGVVWLDTKQGNDTISLMLPARMEAVACMIAEAFNAHMMEPTRIKVSGHMKDEFGNSFITPFPTGSAMSVASLLTVASALDEDAAHAVERRDLP